MELAQVILHVSFADRMRFEKIRKSVTTAKRRLLYIFDGTGVLQCGNARWHLQSGCMAVLQAGAAYTLRTDTALDALVADFSCEDADSPLLSGNVFLRDAESLCSTLLRLAAEYREKRLQYSDTAQLLLKTVLTDADSLYRFGASQCELVGSVIHYIEEHLTEHISNTQISQSFGYSPNYINRLMLRHTGKTLHQYVLQRRLDLSVRLLLSTNTPISEIAMSLGFNSPSHFSCCFRNQIGVTPISLRQ